MRHGQHRRAACTPERTGSVRRASVPVYVYADVYVYAYAYCCAEGQCPTGERTGDEPRAGADGWTAAPPAYECAHVYVHMHIHVHIHVHVHMHIHVHVHVHMHMHMHVHVHVQVPTLSDGSAAAF